MRLTSLKPQSLKARVTLSTSVIFILCIGLLGAYLNQKLREGLELEMGGQQLSTVSLLAEQINQEILNRFELQQLVADEISPALLGNAAAVQQHLKNRPVLQHLFNGGTFVARADGKVIASLPVSANRIGLNMTGQDFMVETFKQGKPFVGSPVVGKGLKVPVIPIAVPIHNAQKQVIGVLVGVINLSKANLLDNIMSGHYNKTGDYALISPLHRFFITGTDKSRTMTALPSVGVSAAIDRFVNGFEGSQVYVNPLGVEVLVSAKSIPATGWLLVARMPTAEAFEPIQRQQWHMIRGAFLAVLLACALVWWLTARIVKRQLAGMLAATQSLETIGRSDQTTLAIPIVTNDEVGELIAGFNRLLNAMSRDAQRWIFAIEGSGVGVWDWNLQTGEALLSKRWKETLGFSEDEIKNEATEWSSRVHPDDLPMAMQAIQAHLNGETPSAIVELRMRCKDGQYIWTLGRGMLVSRSADGKPLRLVGTQEDITERKHNIQRLTQSEEQLSHELINVRLAIDQHAIVCTTDVQGRITSANHKFSEITGYALTELLGKDHCMINSGTHPHGFFKEMYRTVTAGHPWHGEVCNRAKDGHLYWVQTTIVPFMGEDGKPFQYVAIRADITQRKKLEFDLLEHNRNLETLVKQKTEVAVQNEQLLRSVINTSLDSIIGMNAKGCITEWSKQCEITFGWSFAEVEGRYLHEFIIPHRYRDAHQKGMAHYLETGIGPVLNQRIEIFALRRDRSEFPIELAISPIITPQGTSFSAFIRDVTQRKIEQATLETAKLSAESASRAKSDFLSNMSHEIRTPMNGVIGMVDILQQSTLTPEQHRMLDVVHHSSLSLLHILNDILDYSKIEAGKLSIEIMPTPLREVAEGVAQLLANSSGNKSIALSVFVDPALPKLIDSDPTRLRQVLLNLLGNAIKFTHNRDSQLGRVILRVIPSRLADGRASVQFHVNDNGIGMSPAQQKRLFQPFTQADESTARKYGGTGLGLSICQRLVELLGGTITVSSTEGQGSDFTVELPMQVSDFKQIIKEEPNLTGIQVFALIQDSVCAQIAPDYCRAAGAQVTLVADFSALNQHLQNILPADLNSSVVLLGVDLATLPEDFTPPKNLGIVQLIPAGHRRNSLSNITVSTRPMLYHDLIQGVALACGRSTIEGKGKQTERRIRVRETKTLNVDAALHQGQLILLAEDNETNREVMQEQLRLLGYTCEIAEDGIVALQMWRTGRYALLLTDCNMPNMDGFELTAKIRETEPAGTHLPIIAVTANAMPSETLRCLELGMDAYLSKPLRLNELSTMLAKWLPAQNVPERIENAPPEMYATLESNDPLPNAAAILPVTWDATTLTRMVGDNQGMHQRLLEKFLLTAPVQLNTIHEALTTAETATAVDVAHKLKSVARTVGALMLGELCQKMETAGRAGDLDTCRALVEPLHGSFEETKAAITQHLA